MKLKTIKTITLIKPLKEAKEYLYSLTSEERKNLIVKTNFETLLQWESSSQVNLMNSKETRICGCLVEIIKIRE